MRGEREIFVTLFKKKKKARKKRIKNNRHVSYISIYIYIHIYFKWFASRSSHLLPAHSSSGLVPLRDSLIEVVSARLTHIFTKDTHLTFSAEERKKGGILSSARRIPPFFYEREIEEILSSTGYCVRDHVTGGLLVSMKRSVLLKGVGRKSVRLDKS